MLFNKICWANRKLISLIQKGSWEARVNLSLEESSTENDGRCLLSRVVGGKRKTQKNRFSKTLFLCYTKRQVSLLQITKAWKGSLVFISTIYISIVLMEFNRQKLSIEILAKIIFANFSNYKTFDFAKFTFSAC